MGELSVRRALLRLAAALTAVLAVCALGATPARALAPEGFSWSATVDDRPQSSISAASPLRLGQRDQTQIQVVLRNSGTSDVRIRSVRLAGQVIGLTFFSFTTRVDIVLPPGDVAERRINLDLDALTDQAVGLIPSEISLLGPDRRPFDAKPLAVDVQGSALSVYGVFGFAVAGITAVLLVSLLIAIWRRRLPTNWWRRGVRFLPVGLGAGLTLTFTLSAFGLLLPDAATWVSLVLALGAGAFLVGYFLPQGRQVDEQPPPPDEADEDQVDDQEDQDELLADRGPLALQRGSVPKWPDSGGSTP